MKKIAIIISITCFILISCQKSNDYNNEISIINDKIAEINKRFEIKTFEKKYPFVEVPTKAHFVSVVDSNENILAVGKIIKKEYNDEYKYYEVTVLIDNSTQSVMNQLEKMQSSYAFFDIFFRFSFKQGYDGCVYFFVNDKDELLYIGINNQTVESPEIIGIQTNLYKLN